VIFESVLFLRFNRWISVGKSKIICIRHILWTINLDPLDIILNILLKIQPKNIQHISTHEFVFVRNYYNLIAATVPIVKTIFVRSVRLTLNNLGPPKQHFNQALSGVVVPSPVYEIQAGFRGAKSFSRRVLLYPHGPSQISPSVAAVAVSAYIQRDRPRVPAPIVPTVPRTPYTPKRAVFTGEHETRRSVYLRLPWRGSLSGHVL